MEPNQPFWRRLLHIEPGLALGQWVYDRLANNWALLVSIFAGGGGMSWLASVEHYMEPYGNLGIAAVGIVSALFIWIGLSLASSLFSRGSRNRAERDAIIEWRRTVDSVNPMDPEFKSKRLNISDLTSPIDGRIRNKQFVDCELIGPANIAFLRDMVITGVHFVNCDFVATKKDVYAQTVVGMENVKIYDGIISRATIFLHPDLIPTFLPSGGQLNFLTEIPNPTDGTTQPPNTAPKRQP